MLSDEEKKALKVVNKRTERLIEELKIEEEDLIDEPKIAYLITQIEANKTLLNLIEKQSKEIEEYKKQLDLDYVDKHFVPVERYNQLEKEIEELKEKNNPQPDCAEPIERTEEMVNMKWVNHNYILKTESEQKEKKAYIDGINISDKLCNKKWEDKIKAMLENEIINISGFECVAKEDVQSLLEKE